MSRIDAEIAADVFQCFQNNMDNLTDFMVIVDDNKFNCHRFVLSSCSGFFEALIRTDMKEKAESRCTIEGITPEIFGLILDVIYKGKNVLNVGNMLELWKAANQLQIQLLIKACEKFVINHTNVQNYKTILQNAEMLNSSSVMKAVKNVLAASYYELVYSNNFMQVSFEELLEILLNSNLKVCADFSVSSVLKWASADTNSSDGYNQSRSSKTATDTKYKDSAKTTYRRICLYELFKTIPLQSTSKKCLSMLMSNEFVVENKSAIIWVNGFAAKRMDVELGTQRGVIKDKDCPHCKPFRTNSKMFSW